MIRIKNILSLTIMMASLHLYAYGQSLTDSTKNKTVAAVNNEDQAENYRLHNNDWADLKYYQDDNKKLGVDKKDLVLLIGDSITELWGEIDSSFFNANKNYVDRGISGQTTPQILLRFRQDVIDLKPKVVVILAGTNDIAGNTGPATIEQIFGNLLSMIELAKANHIKVVICSLLPAFNYFWNEDIKPAGKIIMLNHKLKAYAALHHITYLDYHSALKDYQDGFKKNLTRDGVHPNIIGYKVMEPLLKNTLKSMGY